MKIFAFVNGTDILRTYLSIGTLVTLVLFFASCGSDDGASEENADSDSTETEFTIDVSGSFSRDMEGTNATYRFNEMPSGFVTPYQLAIYLTDAEGYTVTATILVEEAELPPPGDYNVTDWSSGVGLQPLDAGLIFGQNGGMSHNTAGSSFGEVSISETGTGFLSGTLVGNLTPTADGSGLITMNGTFQAEFNP